MTTQVTVSPFPRAEGDIKVGLSIDENRVTDARVSGVLFRGFEKLLLGRDPMDALVFAPRICGICSIGHSTAASNMLRRFYHSDMPENAFWMRNAILGAEMIMSHLTHFYMHFGVDLTDKQYQNRSGYKKVSHRFSPMGSEGSSQVLRTRRKVLEILGLLAGKWPNCLALQPGGVTRAVTRSDLMRVMGICKVCRAYIEENLLGGPIDSWLDVKSHEELNRWLSRRSAKNSDLGLFCQISRDWGLTGLGKGASCFLSSGAFELPGDGYWLPPGVWVDGSPRSFDAGQITEDIRFSWYGPDEAGSIPPGEGETRTVLTKDEAYSWVKAPRYQGAAMEVGPLARQVMAEDALILDLVNRLGVNVFTRMLARLHELIRLVNELGRWIQKIDPDQPFCVPHQKKMEGESWGLAEVSRGCLGHWMRVEEGIIVNYQVISPSTWNFSPRNDTGQPGPVESALAGTHVNDPAHPLEAGHVIRSFDPCLFCAVHTQPVDGNG